MNNEWKEYKLGDCVSIINGYAFKSANFTEKQLGNSLPIVKIKNVANGDVNLDGVQYHSYNDNYKTYLVKNKDILIALTGNHPDALSQVVGGVSIYKLSQEALLNQRVAKIIPNDKIIDRYFLYYFINNHDFHYELASKSSGSASQANISKKDIEDMTICLPSLPMQKCIAGVLSSLDDKIDLLNRQNQTLEAMSESLFRHWFNDKINDGTIEQLIYIQNGFAFKSKDFKENGENGVIKIKNISGGIIQIDNTDYVDSAVIKSISDRFSISTSDILIAMTGAEIGKLGIIPKTNKKLWLNQRVGLLVEKYKGAKYLAYLQLKNDFGQDHIENTATGSAQPNISATGIEKCSFPKLDEKLIIEYSEQIGELYDKVISNLGQIITLTKLRDTLLPKLMNNEIKI